MIITIYDYSDKKKEITLPDKEISRIFVAIFSGDETGHVEFVDGTTMYFDASTSRFMSFYDGQYVVEGKNIEKWINFVPSGQISAAYERQEDFMYE